MSLVRILCVFFGFAIASVSYGHHSDAGYNRDAVIVLEAEVVRYVFRNPHVTIYVEAEDQAGNLVEWEIETGSTPIMQRSGWTRDLLSQGASGHRSSAISTPRSAPRVWRASGKESRQPASTVRFAKRR